MTNREQSLSLGQDSQSFLSQLHKIFVWAVKSLEFQNQV